MSVELAEDEQVVEEIVELAERTALAFRNEEGGATRTLQWYDMLVQVPRDSA